MQTIFSRTVSAKQKTDKKKNKTSNYKEVKNQKKKCMEIETDITNLIFLIVLKESLMF